MSKTVNVKYFAETAFAKEPQKATEESAGYDLYVAEAKTIMPDKNDLVSLDFRWAIPKGFCSRIFPRSSLNHSGKVFTVPTGDRIAQVVFFEKFAVHFEKVSKKEELGVTKRGSGFGSTGITVIKKMKVSEDEQAEDDDLAVTAEEGIITVNDEVILHEKVDNKT